MQQTKPHHASSRLGVAIDLIDGDDVASTIDRFDLINPAASFKQFSIIFIYIRYFPSLFFDIKMRSAIADPFVIAAEAVHLDQKPISKIRQPIKIGASF